MTMAYLMFGLLFVLLVTGIPVGMCLGLSTIVTLIIRGNALTYPMVAQRMFTTMDQFPLMAVPFFILAGNLMERGGISERLIAFMKMLVGRLPATSPTITTASSAFFGAISGSNPATVAAIGGIMVPSMIRTGYKREEAAAVAAASGTLGVVIPPSIPMVTYGVIASVSVGALFMGGVIPGLMLAGAITIVHMINYRHVETGKVEKLSLGQKMRVFRDASWSLGMPLIILGGIYGGIFTPTEAAAVACFYSFFVGAFVYKDLKMNELFDILKRSVKGTSTAMYVLCVAAPFAWLMTSAGLPLLVADAVLSAVSSKYMIFLIINIILLFLGCFIDTQSIILLTTPLLLPIAANVGLSPVALGVIIVMNASIGMITPPFATNLFVANSIAGLKSIGPISRKILPYLTAEVIVLLICTFFSGIIMLLPRALGLAF